MADLRLTSAGANINSEASGLVTAELAAETLTNRPVQAEAVEEPPRTIVEAQVVPSQDAGSLSDEPIARGLQIGLTRLRQRWDRANFNTPTRFCLLLIGVVLFIVNAGWLVPSAFFLGTIYAGYLVVWMLLTPAISEPKPTPPVATPQPPRPTPAAARQQPPRHRKRPFGKASLSRSIFRERPRVDRAADLVGSLLLSTLVVAVLSIIMLVVGSPGLDTSFYGWAPTYAWMLLTSLVGTWIVLIHGKVFEGSEGDPVLRRFSMLVGGIALGATATGLSTALFVEPTYLLETRPAVTHMPEILYRVDGSPRMLAAMGYFGGIMLLLRWWRMADPLRTTRLSIVATVGCVLTAVLMHLVLPYPRGFLIAATMAMAIQISAPWLSRRKRERLVDEGAPLSQYG